MAHITANSLLQRPSPTLVTIPRECLLLIVERLPFQSLLTLAQASRYLSVIASEPTLWIHLSLRDYNHDPTPYLSTNSAFPFKSPKQVYLSAFVRWAPKYGIWQGDFPFYEGEMVVVRPNFDRGEINFWLIRGENRSRDDEDDPDPEAPFSKDRNVMVDLFDVGVEEDEILSIGFGIPEDAEQDIEAMGYRVEIMGPTEAEKARMTKWEEDKRRRNLENKGQIGSFFICGRFVPPHPHASVVTLKELMQNTENRDKPRWTPNPETGLWPFPTSAGPITQEVTTTGFVSRDFPPLNFSIPPPITSFTHPTFAILCSSECSTHRFMNATTSATMQSVLLPTSYTSCFSKIVITPPNPVALPDAMAVKPIEGIWAGTYGGHGVEFLLLRYTLRCSPTSSSSSSSTTSQSTVYLEMHKITGDHNVPRGEVSLRAEIGNGVGNGKVRSGRRANGRGIELDETDEFKGLRAYWGEGKVAGVGFRHPTRIPCDVILISPKEIAVYWQGLMKISRFKLVERLEERTSLVAEAESELAYS